MHLAEITSLIVPIGRVDAAHGLRAARSDWQEEGHPNLSVAVNLSARQFQQPDLVEQVKRALDETGLPPALPRPRDHRDATPWQNAEATIHTLRELKALGVRISIDDFGIGYSSLSYLKRLPIDTLKIDQSFVRDITTDPDDAAIATAVIALAHTLKLQVVAEGVETQEQLEFLAARHCDRMQGFLFSRPLPARRVRGVPGPRPPPHLIRGVTMAIATDCIHAGQEPDPTTGAVVMPIYQTSTYVQQGIGQHKGYEYGRTHNPTRRALEKNLAALEKRHRRLLLRVRHGRHQRRPVADQVRAARGGLRQRVRRHAPPLHEDPGPVRGGRSRSSTRATPAPSTRRRATSTLLWIETPTNPLMKVCDIAALAEVAHRRRALLVVDNTFMSPFFQRPLELGADIVVHSTTKFLNGHSDSVGGVAVVKDKAHARVAAVLPERGGRDPVALRLLARSCAAPRPWPCACRATRRTGGGWPRTCASRRACARSTGRGSPTIPATRCTSGRPAASAP